MQFHKTRLCVCQLPQQEMMMITMIMMMMIVTVIILFKIYCTFQIKQGLGNILGFQGEFCDPIVLLFPIFWLAGKTTLVSKFTGLNFLLLSPGSHFSPTILSNSFICISLMERDTMGQGKICRGLAVCLSERIILHHPARLPAGCLLLVPCSH